jgi:hypothetical protein
MSKFYNVIMGTSSAAYGGVRYSTFPHTETDIIGFGEKEAPNGLCDWAGIELVETADGGMVAIRPWEPGEQLKTALEVLRDDGRTFDVYDTDSEAETAEYRAECERLGL